MTKSTEHCMPNVTPSKPLALKTARIFPTVDRCDHIKGFKNEDYLKEGFNSYRDIENEQYRFTIPRVIDGIAKFAYRIRPKPFANRLSVDEIDLIIRDKFINERHSVQELFRASDVHKHGFVTKEALMKIIFSICGLVKIDHFYKLLERYNLNAKSVITFEEMEKSFGLPPTSKFPPPVIFHGMGQPYKVSAAFGLQLIREAALDEAFDLKQILPESCFEKDGMVLMSQFREALKRIKIGLCDEDFIRLWIKIDTKGVGSIALKKLLFILNLQEDGKPMCGLRPNVIPLKRPKLERVVRTKPPLKYTNCYELLNQVAEPNLKAGGISFPIIKPYTWTPKGPGGSDDYEFGKGTQFLDGLQLLRENRPDFNSVFDKLSYIFEEPYQDMLVVFKHFDPKNSGMVPIETGLKILSEYGFKLELDNLVKFLSKIYCLDQNAGMNYKKMIGDIQSKGAGSHVNRMISQIITAQNQSSGLKSLRTMSVEEIEDELYKILHKDFIAFQSQLERCSHNSNFIYENYAKKIIESILGYSMTKDQWKDLQNQFEYDRSYGDDDDENVKRSINFRKFLEKFDKPTGICRYRYKSDKSSGHGRKKTGKREMYDPPRNFSVLCRMIADKLKFRFHQIDKQYKSFPNTLQGTLTRDILLELLNSQNCKLTNQEMDVIWNVVESEPNYSSWHYRQILKHLMMSLYRKADEISVENRKLKLSVTEDPNISVLREFKKSDKEIRLKQDEYHTKKIEMALKVTPFTVNLEKKNKTIETLSPTMKDIWQGFKKQIRQVDVSGNTNIELFEMKELLNKNGFVLSPDDMENLLYSFDLRKNGRFHYIPFLNEFSKFDIEAETAKPSLHFDRVRHQLLNQKTGQNITVTETYKAIRKSLIKKWKSLIRAFRKIDTTKTGKLDITQLNGIILDAGIQLSQDDLYHVFSGFDKNLDGKIDYVEFIEQLLDVFLPRPD